jgi:predicted transcriptional regulator
MDDLMNNDSLALMDEAPIIMGSNELEMMELFRKLNVSRPVACTLTCLAKGREIPSQKIEVLTGLRQPEVSIAMRYLLENNWINVNEEKRSLGKGRPTKLYRLKVPITQIINVIEEKVLVESRLLLSNIETLKKMSHIENIE